MSERFRDRKYCMVLYPEDPTHLAVLELLNKGYSYIGILHDKDTWTEDDTDDAALLGTLKKPHYHIVLKFPQARWNTAVADELGIAPNYLQKCVSYQGSVCYLIHDGLPSKYQYAVEDCFGPLVKDLKKFMRGVDEVSRVWEIVNFIENSDWLEYSDLLKWCLKNDLYGDLRRMGQGAFTLICNHNDKINREFTCDKQVDLARFDGYIRGHQDGMGDIRRF